MHRRFATGASDRKSCGRRRLSLAPQPPPPGAARRAIGSPLQGRQRLTAQAIAATMVPVASGQLRASHKPELRRAAEHPDATFRGGRRQSCPGPSCRLRATALPHRTHATLARRNTTLAPARVGQIERGQQHVAHRRGSQRVEQRNLAVESLAIAANVPVVHFMAARRTVRPRVRCYLPPRGADARPPPSVLKSRAPFQLQAAGTLRGSGVGNVPACSPGERRRGRRNHSRGRIYNARLPKKRAARCLPFDLRPTPPVPWPQAQAETAR